MRGVLTCTFAMLTLYGAGFGLFPPKVRERATVAAWTSAPGRSAPSQHRSDGPSRLLNKSVALSDEARVVASPLAAQNSLLFGGFAASKPGV
jgi:hypothetical protein